MDLSVVIPTRGRSAKLARCVRALATQTLDHERFEVLIGLDGPDDSAARIARDAWMDRPPQRLRIAECPREGYNAARNRLLEVAQGRILVSLNDDVIPEASFLEAHLAAHEEHKAAGRRAIITGYSPWRIFDDDTLFDRLVRQTSMIFFYDQMVDDGGSEETLKVRRGPDHDWGFRHCWGLNFSVGLDAVREVGGFVAVPLAYGYDDIEMAWRLQTRFGLPVLFRPGARAVHDHRYQPREVLDREQRLGCAAWHFASLRPEFARAVFGRNVRDDSEVAYSREFVKREAGAAQRIEEMFLRLSRLPGIIADGPHERDLLTVAYQQHLLLKRWYWRRGLLEAADST